MTFKEIRKKLRFTQTEAAELLGISMRTVQNYEYGGKVPYEIMDSFKEEYDKIKGSGKSEISRKGYNISLYEEKDKILSKIPKDIIVAYIENNIKEFEKVKEYNAFIQILIKDGVIKELIEKFGNSIK